MPYAIGPPFCPLWKSNSSEVDGHRADVIGVASRYRVHDVARDNQLCHGFILKNADSLLSPVLIYSEFEPYWNSALIGTSRLVFSGLPSSSKGTFKARTPGASFTPTAEL